MNKDKLKPMLFSTLKSYTLKQFGTDVLSGIIVAIIALPLSIALALASGVYLLPSVPVLSFLFSAEVVFR